MTNKREQHAAKMRTRNAKPGAWRAQKRRFRLAQIRRAHAYDQWNLRRYDCRAKPEPWSQRRAQYLREKGVVA